MNERHYLVGSQERVYHCGSIFTWYEGRTEFYIVEKFGRFTISRARTARRWRFTAWRVQRGGWKPQHIHKWHYMDSGWLGTFKTLQEALDCCLDYEIAWQAGQINGRFYGPWRSKNVK